MVFKIEFHSVFSGQNSLEILEWVNDVVPNILLALKIKVMVTLILKSFFSNISK